MHECDPDVIPGGIGSVRLVSREISARKHSDTTPFPKGCRSCFSAAEIGHIQPKKEGSLRSPVAVAALKDSVGDVEIFAVDRAALLDMVLVALGLDRDMLHR